ncbi:MAG TPA: hypothetical protein PK926_03475 [Spirochaetota bacterium]|nr:hypothetical protein [Spirochaetota bacterium]HPI88799.1 hypothetical protein [Spirochaetota bacterium]HPR47127.1 hypothetical protein [Spirochaetota bacterium]
MSYHISSSTSALDGHTENIIMDTIIMIAHRLTTLKKCDIIYVMKKGKIVESGTYEELSHSGGYVKEQDSGGIKH